MDIKLDITLELRQLSEQLLSSRASLAEILSDIEETKILLGDVKREYYGFVGSVVYQTALADAKIQRLRKISEQSNSSNDYSSEEIDQEYASAKDKIDEEFNEIKKDNSASGSSLSDDEIIELKILWKKLSKIYHPDLGGNDPAMMVKINKAYELEDIEFLRNLDNNSSEELEVLGNADHIRKLINKLEKSIEKSNSELRKIKLSFWYDLYLQISRANNKREFYEQLTTNLSEALKEKLRVLEVLKTDHDK